MVSLSRSTVALLAEGVDRNVYDPAMVEAALHVALLAEGVDRNLGSLGIEGVSKKVAHLAEGVDRNFSRMNFVRLFSRRPPRGGRG